MSEGNDTNPNQERKKENPKEVTYIKATGELSAKYPDGHIEKIIVDKQDLDKIASRTSISAEDLKNLRRNQQQPEEKAEKQEK